MVTGPVGNIFLGRRWTGEERREPALREAILVALPPRKAPETQEEMYARLFGEETK